MIKCSKIATLAVLLIFTSCAGIQGYQKVDAAPFSVAHKTEVPAPHPSQQKQPTIQPNFACTNAIKFNLTFSKNRRFAYIVFQDPARTETLKDTRIASGMEYGNGKLFFREYKRHAEFVHLVHGKTRTETCHHIRLQTEHEDKAP